MSASVPPFGIKADHPRNCDLKIQGIPGCRLRSRITASRTVVGGPQNPDDIVIPPDQSRHLGILPEIPGMELHINPEKCTYKILDPLHGDNKILKRIQRGLEQDDRPFRGTKFAGVPPKEGKLDKHRMKTLCRELVQLLECEHVAMAKGPKPGLEEVNELDGNYLTNPGATVPNTQPMFEKDMADYDAKVNEVH